MNPLEECSAIDREFIQCCIDMLGDPHQQADIIRRLKKTAEDLLNGPLPESALQNSRCIVLNITLFNTDPPKFIAFSALSENGLPPAPKRASVCHDEQLTIWASDFVGMLSVGGYLRDDLDYSDGVDLDHAVRRELRSIIEMAFSHPEAITIRALKDRQ